MITTTLTILSGNINTICPISCVRSVSDYATGYDIPRIPLGEVLYQLQWAYTGLDRTVDSNVSYHGYQITVWVHHRLALATDETAYMMADPWPCEVVSRALGNPAFWKLGSILTGTNPDIYDFQEGSDALVLTAPEREGNIISFSAVAKLLLKE